MLLGIEDFAMFNEATPSGCSERRMAKCDAPT
jgi:hypothetical protein